MALKVTIGLEANTTWRDIRVLRVVHNGLQIAEETDCGEPEDNSFLRDYKWIAPLLQQVYELGKEDGHEEGYSEGWDAAADEYY